MDVRVRQCRMQVEESGCIGNGLLGRGIDSSSSVRTSMELSELSSRWSPGRFILTAACRI